MNTKLKFKIIGLGLIVVGGIALYGVSLDSQPDQVGKPTETHYTPDKDDETIKKVFEHGDTYIEYEVGIENGVEETPPPDVLVAMAEAYTDEEKAQMIADFENSDFFKGKLEYLQSVNQDEKSLIDSQFTCDNYKDLAYTWQATLFEEYIYERAVNECITYEEEEEE